MPGIQQGHYGPGKKCRGLNRRLHYIRLDPREDALDVAHAATHND